MKKGILYTAGIALIFGGLFARNIAFHVNEAALCETNCHQKLEQATMLEIRQEPDGFKKEYNIVVNDEVVAKVEGKTIKSFGDSFTVYSPEKKETWLAEDGRQKIPLKGTSLKYGRKSRFEQDGKQKGFIYERLTLKGTSIELRDADNQETALLQGKVLKLRSQFTVTDPTEKTVFAQANKRLNPFVEDIYDVTIENTSTVNTEELLLLLVVADEENDN